MEIVTAWALPIIVLICLLILIIGALKKGSRRVLHSQSLKSKSFDVISSELSSNKDITKLDFKNDKFIYFEFDDTRHSINWNGKYPYLKSLVPFNSNLWIMLITLGIMLSMIEKRITSEMVIDIIYIIILMISVLALFIERKNIKNMWSKEYKAKLRIKHDELVELLNK